MRTVSDDQRVKACSTLVYQCNIPVNVMLTADTCVLFEIFEEASASVPRGRCENNRIIISVFFQIPPSFAIFLSVIRISETSIFMCFKKTVIELSRNQKRFNVLEHIYGNIDYFFLCYSP